MANHACVEIARRAIRNLRTRQVSERMAGTSISVASPRLGFVPQEVLFAALTLRAARNFVRYSATLRSYSGFVASFIGR
ncbi:hypothetical protein T9A_00500 [Alcanivorax jadensis T9]|jgi:hypothetical protein|uniref:Uncharacterized protein n=1 Tax=Alcanivorax jadensis T9 TaxID=1177181 RepID=A0ABR4WF56_9GAMM|nr:hypothetical protein T9A_00500 [Alcanivorax jadensis T9]MBP22211.1 hypothetical protein [Alcanivorax sp.]